MVLLYVSSSFDYDCYDLLSFSLLVLSSFLNLECSLWSHASLVKAIEHYFIVMCVSQSDASCYLLNVCPMLDQAHL